MLKKVKILILFSILVIFRPNERLQKRRLFMRFKRIYIEITNICNLHCTFCPPHHRAPRYMTFAEFQLILKKIKPYTNYIYLHVKGEPLLHPEIDSFLAYAFSQGFQINLTTNGILLKDHLSATKYLRQINLSLHATNDIAIVKVAKEIKDCIVNFRVWNFEENTEAIALLEKEFQVSIPNASNFKLQNQIFVSTQNQFQWPNLIKNSKMKNGYCYALKNQIAILVDGTVVPCCLDHDGNIPLGNIFTQDFTNVFQSERAITMQKGFQNRICVEALCQNCEYKTRF